MTNNDPFPPAEPHPVTSGPAVIDHEPSFSAMPQSAPLPPIRTRRGGGVFAVLFALILFGLVEAQLYGYLNNLGLPPLPAQAGNQGVDALRGQVQALAQAQSQMQANAQSASQAGAQIQTLTQQVQALTDRLDRLEKAAQTTPAQAAPNQAAASPDLGDLPKRVDDLSARVAALQSQPAPAPAPPPDDSAEKQAIADLGQKLDQVQAANKSAQDQLAAQVQSQLQSGQAQMGAQIQSQVQAAQKQILEQAEAAALTQQQSILVQEKTALDQLGSRIDKLEQGAGSVEDAASRATRLERVQAAVVALQAGQKLGDIPNAPPALAKFANEAPPTESALRESFPALAEHAREVSQPQTANRSFLQRAFARLQESVTVRQGDDVLVGDPAAGVLADAELKVQNGDLAGAVQRLQALHGPAASVMQPWVDRAQSLVAARAALAGLAARG
jgi:septal ring factor EnvC (AmiA/AmiB activator)